MKWSEVKVSQSCPTLCDPMDCIVYGILQAKILEWVAIPFSRGSSQPRSQTQVSHLAGGFFTSWATREAHGNTQTSDLRMFICSPVYHGEKLKTTSCPKTRYWLEREVAQSCLTLWDPVDYSLPGSSVYGIFQARVLKWVAIFLLQGIFPTQRSNPGLPHCRQTLYHPSHQESLWYWLSKLWYIHPVKYCGVFAIRVQVNLKTQDIQNMFS